MNRNGKSRAVRKFDKWLSLRVIRWWNRSDSAAVGATANRCRKAMLGAIQERDGYAEWSAYYSSLAAYRRVSDTVKRATDSPLSKGNIAEFAKRAGLDPKEALDEVTSLGIEKFTYPYKYDDNGAPVRKPFFELTGAELFKGYLPVFLQPRADELLEDQKKIKRLQMYLPGLVSTPGRTFLEEFKRYRKRKARSDLRAV